MQMYQQPKTQSLSHNGHSVTQYEQLKNEYGAAGLSYKSNQVLQKISEIKSYPYPFLLEIVKLFHMNQFQVIFFSHILNDQQCPYQADPTIFQTNMSLPQVSKIYNKLTKNGEIKIKITRIALKAAQQQQQEQQDEGIEQNGNPLEEQCQVQCWSLHEIRKLFVYLLVIGYSIKYYLNQSIKPYQDQIKRKYPDFFTNIFNVWVEKYSNKVLRTNPRKINQFYIDLFINEEAITADNAQLDCQYRNYNQIVEELIKATTDVDQGIQEEDRQYVEQ